MKFKEQKTETENADSSSELSKFQIQIPIPDGVKGSYFFDLYREGQHWYAKYVEDIEALDVNGVSFEVEGIGKDTFAVYVTSNNIEEDNKIKYGLLNVDYDAKTAEPAEPFDEEAFLKLAALTNGE